MSQSLNFSDFVIDDGESHSISLRALAGQVADLQSRIAHLERLVAQSRGPLVIGVDSTIKRRLDETELDGADHQDLPARAASGE